MKASFKVADPDKMEATVTLTMTIAEWRRLRGQLNESASAFLWPLNDVLTVIRELVDRVNEHFAEER